MKRTISDDLIPNLKNLSREFINAMKDFAVDQDDYLSLKSFFKFFHCGKDSLLPYIQEADMPDIQKAMEAFRQAVEHLPEDIRKI